MSEGRRFSSQQAVQKAMQALQQQHRREARRWAEQGARIDPTNEEAWLVLAALATPEASLFYLNKALELNPNSQQARKGMHWAVQRLRKSPRRPKAAAGEGAASGLRLPQPLPGDTAPVRIYSGNTQPIRLGKTARPLLAVAAGVLFTLIIALVILGYSNDWIVLARSDSAERPIAWLVKPSLTPTFTATPTPTPTDTPTPTFTPTFTPTDTPTNTPKPTHTPDPTDTTRPAEQDSAPKPETAFAGRWIDVDLTHQKTYAYDGDTLVKAFTVSTGTWQHPTVTGQYHIYVKYRYTDMSGPGYYLPNVPFTMYFYKGYGLHGTYWHHNFGHPMSHGCVNLPTDDAGWLFSWAEVGTLVNVHY
jgi:lipoprotein-anchoring transpeptidase ErfK/SrfK